jgi:hypothetical protein
MKIKLIIPCVLYFHGVVDVVDAADKHLRGANRDLQFESFDFDSVGGNPFAAPTPTKPTPPLDTFQLPPVNVLLPGFWGLSPSETADKSFFDSFPRDSGGGEDGGGGVTYDLADFKRQAELKVMIDEEIGTPSATQTFQCKSIGFGSRPCGGPSSYLVYSTANTNETRLKELVSEFNQLDKKNIQDSELISICSVEPKPKMELVGGVCTAKRNSNVGSPFDLPLPFPLDSGGDDTGGGDDGGGDTGGDDTGGDDTEGGDTGGGDTGGGDTGGGDTGGGEEGGCVDGGGRVTETFLGITLNAAQQSYFKRQDELNCMIEKEIGTPDASQTYQCASIGFGSRPCGGPSMYLVYSTANTNETRLKELVSEFNQLDEIINQELGIGSICSVEPKPTVVLVDGVCTAKSNVGFGDNSGDSGGGDDGGGGNGLFPDSPFGVAVP